MPPEVTILALDPSTDVTGAALLRFDARGCPECIAHTAIDARELLKPESGLKAIYPSSFEECVARVRLTRAEIASWVFGSCPAFDVVAYEVPYLGNPAIALTGERIAGAAWNYLTLSSFSGCEIIPVTVQGAKAVYGASKLQRAINADAAAKAAKRKLLKSAAVRWCKQTLIPDLADDNDAVADACTVAVAAWRIWHKREKERQSKAAQTIMFGTGSGKSRAKAPKAEAT